jgi:predicted O-methyltransferase YrrM
MNYPSEQFFTEFKKTVGALSCCESIAIYNIASEAPSGVYLELGSHKGKSGMSAALGLKDGIFYLVDPIFEDTKIGDDVLSVVHSTSKSNLDLILIADYSTNIIEKFDDLSYVFVDSGSHADGLPMQEVKMLEDRVKSGGIICFHDFNSQFHEVREAYDYLISTGKYEPISIDWTTIVKHVKENDLEKGNESWHHTELDFPCFVGAVKRK